MSKFIFWITHLDKQHLESAIRHLGPNVYFLLAGVIFAETAFVILPFLPGDSLLIPVGLLCRNGLLDLKIVLLTVPVAAVLGDTINFHLGQWLGKHLFHEKARGIFKPQNLDSTKEFFAHHGTKAIIIGRFVPIVRALAPFVAGMEGMPFRKFLPVSAIGAFLWVWGCVLLGYAFGDIPFFQDNFEKALLLLFAVMGLMLVVERLIHRKMSKDKRVKKAAEAVTKVEPTEI